MNSKTRHLDTAITILRGDACAKRALRKAQAEVVLLLDANYYTITVNGKTVEAAEGNTAYAQERAELRAESIRKLGKSVTVTVY